MTAETGTAGLFVVGDAVVVDADQVPADWTRAGEVVEYDGQSYVVELADGHRCQVLPDQVQPA